MTHKIALDRRLGRRGAHPRRRPGRGRLRARHGGDTPPRRPRVTDRRPIADRDPDRPGRHDLRGTAADAADHHGPQGRQDAPAARTTTSTSPAGTTEMGDLRSGGRPRERRRVRADARPLPPRPLPLDRSRRPGRPPATCHRGRPPYASRDRTRDRSASRIGLTGIATASALVTAFLGPAAGANAAADRGERDGRGRGRRCHRSVRPARHPLRPARARPDGAAEGGRASRRPHPSPGSSSSRRSSRADDDDRDARARSTMTGRAAPLASRPTSCRAVAPLMGGRVGVHLDPAGELGRGGRARRAADADAVLRRIAAWADRLTRFTTTSELSRLNAIRGPRCRSGRPSPPCSTGAAHAEGLTGGIVDIGLLDARLAAERIRRRRRRPRRRRPSVAFGGIAVVVARSSAARRGRPPPGRTPVRPRRHRQGVAGRPGARPAWPATAAAVVDADGDVAIRLDPGDDLVIRRRRSAPRRARPRGPAPDRARRRGRGADGGFGLATSGTSVHRWARADRRDAPPHRSADRSVGATRTSSRRPCSPGPPARRRRWRRPRSSSAPAAGYDLLDRVGVDGALAADRPRRARSSTRRPCGGWHEVPRTRSAHPLAPLGPRSRSPSGSSSGRPAPRARRGPARDLGRPTARSCRGSSSDCSRSSPTSR